MINKMLLLSVLIIAFANTNCSPVQKDQGKETVTPQTETTTTLTETTNTSSDIPVGIAIGNKAPEIEYKSPDGKTIKLSSLKGQLVLIDFWASWCPPCRVENPNLVSTFNQFKNSEFKVGKGFTIYSVSLDQQKERWLGAIKSDNLSWTSHVSDLKGWQSVPAAMYQVRSIPSNFLIDGKGIIIATNLRGENLGLTLSQLLK